MAERLSGHMKGLAERLLRIIPLAAIMVVLSYWTAQQIVSPHHRMIKVGILAAVLLFMFRFDMIYSLFVFILLFPFPSGISIGSTNTILMTLIGLTWAIRAASTGQHIHERTRYDRAIAFLLIAYVVSFYGTETTRQIVMGINVFWKQIASVIMFYLMIRFVNTEERLMRATKVVGVMVVLVVTTGLLEMFFPGKTIIPGWIGLPQMRGKGSLTFEIEGLRLGGAVGGHNLLSDFAVVGTLFMTFHAIRSRNPLERVFWALALIGSIAVLLGTANRGAVISLGVGMLYGLFHFRKRMSFTQIIVVCSIVIVSLVAIELVIVEHTYAVSVWDRLLGTRFVGLEPDTREGIWQSTLAKSLRKPFIGHGPWFDPGRGLTRQYWPHNAYLFYFYTIGLIGLSAFLWVAWKLVHRSLIYRAKAVWGTDLGDMAMGLHVLLCTVLFSQLRTDHQRDEIHIYVIWLVFALVAACGEIARRRVAESRRGAEAEAGSDGEHTGSRPSALT